MPPSHLSQLSLEQTHLASLGLEQLRDLPFERDSERGHGLTPSRESKFLPYF